MSEDRAPSIVSKEEKVGCIELSCPNCGEVMAIVKWPNGDPPGPAELIHCKGCGTPNRFDAWVTPARRKGDKVGERKNKYARTIKGVQIDFYDIARAFGIIDPAIAHALKKLLRYGCGEKSLAKDVDEAIFSLQRWQQDVTTLQTPAPNDPNPIN